MRRELIHIVVLFLTATLCSCATGRRSEAEESHRVVHLSLDDVEVFSDLIYHQQDYDSLFQHPFMTLLQEMHRKHGMRITLYTYEQFGNLDNPASIKDMPLKYNDDFQKASDWLRIGFHSPRAEFDSLVTVAEFRNSYNRLNSAIAQFADSSMIASTLRFHYFFAPDSILNALRGIRSLLCADHDNVVSYNLTPSEASTVANGGEIMKNNISFRKTDLRIDDNLCVISDLNQLNSVDTLVVFTHEWKLWHNPDADLHRGLTRKVKVGVSESVNQALFKETVKWLDEAGYTFSFLE